MADEILHKVDMDWLLCIYGAMLTKKQRDIASLYYEEDFSLAEIAQQQNVSRQSVHETLQRVEKQLRTWEEQLGVRQRLTRAQNAVQQALAALPDGGCEAARMYLNEALSLLNDEEDSNGL